MCAVHVILQLRAEEERLRAECARIPARADPVLQHVHLHGRRMREEHVTHVAADLAALALERVIYQMALQFGRRVEDGVADLALVDVSLLHHVGSHVHLYLVFRRKGLLALYTLECLLVRRCRRRRRKQLIFTLHYARWTPAVRVM